MKKILCLLLCFIACFCCFCGCAKKGPLPNGYYVWSSQGENIFVFTKSDIRDSFGWEIDGTTVQRWTSGSVDYKAKIIERGDKIYFEGYKWKELFSSVKSGTETVYEAIYDDIEKSITLVRYK